MPWPEYTLIVFSPVNRSSPSEQGCDPHDLSGSVGFDLKVRRDARPFVDLQPGPAQVETRASVLLIGLRREAQRAE